MQTGAFRKQASLKKDETDKILEVALREIEEMKTGPEEELIISDLWDLTAQYGKPEDCDALEKQIEQGLKTKEFADSVRFDRKLGVVLITTGGDEIIFFERPSDTEGGDHG